MIHLNTMIYAKHCQDVGLKMSNGPIISRMGGNRLKSSIDSNNPYDLIITDMYYPGEPGGREEQSGDVLIDRVIKNKSHNTCNSLLQRESQIPGNIWLCLL